MDDLLREFLTETSESLDTVDNQLVRFEQEPNNAKILDNIFRLVHTIKGTCGFLGLPRLEALAHAAETLMGKFRDGMPVTGQAVTLILTTIDRIKDILGQLEATEAEPDGSDQDLIDELEAMVERGMKAMTAAGCRRLKPAPAGRCKPRGGRGLAGAADAGAAAAPRRSVARRTGARLPRDRDRSGTRAGRCACNGRRTRAGPRSPPSRHRRKQSPPPRPNPRTARRLSPPRKSRRPTRSPTSRSASTSIRWNT